MTAGEELKAYQKQWLTLLADWYCEHGEAVEEEQIAFDLHRQRSRAA